MQPGESPDVYLADLRRLSSLFGGVSEKTLGVCLCGGTAINNRAACTEGENLCIDRLLSRARSATGEDWEVSARSVAAAGVPEGIQRRCFHNTPRTAPGRASDSSASTRRLCWVC